MNFSDNEDPIDLSQVNLVDMLMNSDVTPEESKREMAATKGSMSDMDMGIEELGAIAQFVDMAVKTAFREVIAMAKSLDQSSVPVFVLEELSNQPSIAAKMLWDAADFVGINLIADTPDDLSGLEGF